MKILVIDEWLPWPLDSGKKIRTYNLIKHLSKSHVIIYVAYVELPEEEEKLRQIENIGIKVVPVEDVRLKKWTLRFYFSVMLNFLSMKAFSTEYHIKDIFSQKLKKVIRKENPDIVHCEWTNLAPFLGDIKGIPSVIAAHNIESDIWKRLAENTFNPLKRFLGKQQEKKIKKLELEWYPKVNHCIAVSPDDQKVINSYGANVSLVENGVELDYYNNIDNEIAVDENRLSFVASFDTFSNQDGVHYFVRSIWPLIYNKNPNASFWIVGKNPPKNIINYVKKDQNIHVTGTVPDVREYIAKSSLCVVPLRIGGGSRLKILEAMAMEKPIISTTVGAEGLRVENRKEIILADEPELFADAVLELLKNKEQRAKLGKAGLNLATSFYSWKSLAEKQNVVWENLVL